ncbi:DNA polymerase III subunit beta [Limisalsivibrio acetivorans]|uniref:DNA polymerase III subunit beta n=1 Tax=Limisalsivibrio acetivorans TaxID=1304888 RepID=UPI0003B6180B|nr:DNA polymerase III subunit beta [Limisalsivibrio acetivorans]
MRFKVVKDDIYPIVQYANSYTSPKNLNTVLQNILIEAEGEKLTLRSTNMQIGFSCTMEASIEEIGTVTVSGKKLLDIVKELPDGSVIDFNHDGSKLNIKSGKSSFKLSTISPELFPTMSEITPEYFFKIKSEALHQLLKKTAFSVSNDASKIEYTGAHFSVYGNRLEISAADFQRIATAKAVFDEEFSDEFTINIPKKTVMELMKILDDEEEIEIETDKKQVMFKTGSIVIYSKLIEKYIKSITKLFDSEYPIKAKLNRKLFAEVVRRVSTITSEITHGVVLSFEDGNLSVNSLETEYGQGHELIEDVVYEGEPMDIIFNARHILEIVSNIDTDYFTLQMQGRRNPAIIVPEDEDYKYLVVPISIDKF